MDLAGEAHQIAAELSSPPSSLSDLSPQRSDPHLASRDTSVYGVSAQHPGLHAQPPPPPTVPDEKPRRTRGPVVLPDGTVRERKKPGPKPKPKDPSAPEKPKRKRAKASDGGPTSAPTPPPPAAAAPPQQENSHYYPQPASLVPQSSGPRQSKITDLVNPVSVQPRSMSDTYHNSAAPTPTPPQPQQVSHLHSQPATPRPASSGQVFDPIRGEVSSRVSNPSYSPSAGNHHPQQQASRFAPSASVTSAPVSPVPAMAKSSTSVYTVAQPSPSLVAQRSSAAAPQVSNVVLNDQMDIDSKPLSVPKVETGSAGPSSNAPTPPPQKRAKEQPPPLPTGSGLLSGTPFGGIGAASSNGDGKTGTNIWLTFSLKGQTNVTINFAREVEKRYGFAALHPRLAARKERQRQLAAASNALEKAAGLTGSADEMSLDLSEPDSANEGDATANDDASNAQPGDGVKKRRKRKAEDYDRNDEFIDDAEMAWEESALMTRDGFFVYSGPLLAENEKPTMESANGTSKRGRGRGRGGAARGDAAGRGSRGGATGGGRGSRGGTTARKPRITKAERATMEQEKLEREKKGASLATKSTPQHSASLPAAPALPSQSPAAVGASTTASAAVAGN